MPQLSYPYTLVAGTLENVNQVQSNFDAAKSLVNGGLGTDNLLTSTAGITDAQLAAPNNAAYKTILHAGSSIAGGAAASSFFFTRNGNFIQDTTAGTQAPVSFYFDSADYTVASKTQKLRLRLQVYCNAVAPGTITFTFGLYSFTVGGATANNINYTAGTLVGSTISIVNPALSSLNQAVGSDLTIPANGHYAPILGLSAGTAANTLTVVTVQVQTRSV